MVENLLEPGAETERLPATFSVSVEQPLSRELIACTAIKLGRFTVVKLPSDFLDAIADPLALPLPTSASDASDENTENSEISDASADLLVPQRKLFPVFQPRPNLMNSSRSKRVTFKKKPRKSQAQIGRTQPSSSSLRKQACIAEYFAKHGPITGDLHSDSDV